MKLLSRVSRRDFVRTGASALALPALLLAETPEAAETEDNQEGPFYKPGAPVRARLVEKGMRGTPLLLAGKVLGLDGRPLENAELDFWQANADGAYDNAGYTLRGRIYTQAGGLYRLETIIPKYYSAGSALRPPHIHVKARKREGPVLTTQLYFRGDPLNYQDASVRPSLLLDLKDDPAGRRAEFDFVIRTR